MFGRDEDEAAKRFSELLPVKTYWRQIEDFHNWNKIKIRYCDGASFSEDVEAVEPDVLSGCSAGGLTSILHFRCWFFYKCEICFCSNIYRGLLQRRGTYTWSGEELALIVYVKRKTRIVFFPSKHRTTNPDATFHYKCCLRFVAG
ncbi:unnamed protein product [Fraxinus pennsylvanica]|uniref:Pectin acetylesterase n=1 Tax=Fraxinus pennsylvanica TaxID=56036 RepID=A0AAD2AAX5_9LAMI|nr:unnamed protein product [Fraxinus pennsylvanica]